MVRRMMCVMVGAVAAAVLCGQATGPATRPVRGGARIESFPGRPASYFASAEGQRLAENILTWQTPHGAWDKNYDPRNPHVEGTPFGEWVGVDTIDNAATYSELRILAKANAAKADPRFVAAFLKGFDTLLAAQYANGGWPQRFPTSATPYGLHITFNDDAMTEVMVFLQEIVDGAPEYGFVDAGRRAQAKAAFEKGLDCILKCQIVKDGKLTDWCAQHDEVTLAPAGARAYELPSFSGSEGAHLAIFLMHQKHPDERIKAAVRGAAAWFEKVEITGIRVQPATDAETGLPDRVVVEDANAPALWARFYDLDTEKPFFCGRDGIKKGKLSEIERERRAGYAWYGNWGAAVAEEYARWEKENP